MGTWEGWVPVATDLYYNGVNSANFSCESAMRLENTRMYVLSSQDVIDVRFGKSYDIRGNSKLIIEGQFTYYKDMLYIDISNLAPNDMYIKSSSYSSAKSVTLDISQATEIVANKTSFYLNHVVAGGYITRIRLA